MSNPKTVDVMQRFGPTRSIEDVTLGPSDTGQGCEDMVACKYYCSIIPQYHTWKGK